MGAWVGCVYLLSRLSHNRLDVIEDRYRITASMRQMASLETHLQKQLNHLGVSLVRVAVCVETE